MLLQTYGINQDEKRRKLNMRFESPKMPQIMPNKCTEKHAMQDTKKPGAVRNILSAIQVAIAGAAPPTQAWAILYPTATEVNRIAGEKLSTSQAHTDQIGLKWIH